MLCQKGASKMGQSKVYINLMKHTFMIGFQYDKGFSCELYIGCFCFGIGLTESAEGFGFWVR